MSIDATSSARGDALEKFRAVDLEAAGRVFIHYGLVLVLLWIGGMKFTAYEAEGIQAFIRHSPAFSWMNHVLSVRAVSAVIGVSELVIALLIAARPISAHAAALGGALAAGMFVSTLSFLLTTPGVIEPGLGFPAISVVPGQFLLKDIVLFGAAIYTLGEALRALRARRSKP